MTTKKAVKTKKKKTVKTLKARNTRLNFRTNSAEYIIIERKALMYAGGEMSDYLRMAALEFKPAKKENGTTLSSSAIPLIKT